MLSIRKIVIGLVSAVLAFAHTDAHAQSDTIFTAAGFQQNHDYFSGMPNEHIDTSSGALILSFVDFVLPGNAGMDFKWVRTYNSKSGGLAGAPAGLPLGVRFEQPFTGPDHSRPLWLETADGGRQYAMWRARGCPANATCRRWMTKEFWIIDQDTREVYLPNGTVCEFRIESDPNGGGVSGTFKSATDKFGNTIRRLDNGDYEQTIGADTRTIRRGVEQDGTRYVEFNGKTWRESGGLLPAHIEPPGMVVLTSPENTRWELRVNADGLVSELVTPNGASIAYEYEQYNTGQLCQADPPDTDCFIYTPVVSRRTVSGPGLEGAYWTYQYPAYNDNGASPSITRQFTAGGQLVQSLETWYSRAFGAVDESGSSTENSLVKRIVKNAQGGVEETEERHYGNRRVSPSQANGSVVLLDVVVTRDGIAHHTEYTYGEPSNETLWPRSFNHHRPTVVTEYVDGGPRRIRTRFYEYASFEQAQSGILGKLAREGVRIDNGPEFVNSWRYDQTNGFTTEETVDGVTRLFVSEAGNIGQATVGGFTTTFGYSYGVVSSISTPKHSTTRQIYPEGLVQSETKAGRTTAFEYDGLFRITRSMPPGGGDDIVTAYGDNVIEVRRGVARTTISLDGFGRPIGTTTAGTTVGDVRSETVLDANGRTIRQTLPFRVSAGAGPATQFEYDVLGRLRTRTNPGGSSASISYGGSTVTLVDEEGRTTTQTWQRFGGPDDAWLVKVTDAKNSVWDYEYNALGKLTKVAGPDGLTRTWKYCNGAQLREESHPESGTTTYDACYSDGLLRSKTDANTTTFTYTYDANHRLETVSAGSRTTTFAYEPGSDNRQSATIATPDGTIQSLLFYDAAGRLERRVDRALGQRDMEQRLGYDSRDNLQTIVYPVTQRRIDYDFNAANQITGVRNTQAGQSSDFAWAFDYEASGALKSYQTGTRQQPLTHSITYDPNRLWPTSINGGALTLTYSSYDLVGNVKEIADARPGYNQTFRYDELDRMIEAHSAKYGDVYYDYDAHGNRVTNAASTYVRDEKFRLRFQNGLELTYDNNGNMTSGFGAVYTYTPDNQVATSEANGIKASYEYDADGWRLLKNGGAPSVYARGPNGQLLSEVRGTKRRDYIYAGGRLLGMIYNETDAGKPEVEPVPPPGGGNNNLTFRPGFVATAPLGIAFKEAKLLRAAAESGCGLSSTAGCTWAAVDAVQAPPNRTTWTDSTSLTDTPTTGGNFLYVIRVTDVADEYGTSTPMAASMIDNTPDPFAFADQTAAAAAAATESNVILISGILGNIPVAVSGIGSYRICATQSCSGAGSFTIASSTITNGSYIQLRAVASASFGATVSTTLTIGTGYTTWKVTSAPQVTLPNPPLSFSNQSNIAPSTLTLSNIRQVSGISGSVAVTVTGAAMFRVCGDATCSANPAFSSAANTLTNGAYVQLRLTSSSNWSTSVSTTATVGAGSATWSVTTAAPPVLLTTARTGAGQGTISGNGINCGVTCQQSLTQGATVTLTATPSAGHVFTGWSGAGCSGTGACSFTISANVTVTANFAMSCTPASGGTVSVAGAYTVHRFITGGTFNPGNCVTSVEYLIVGGGGGGGSDGGGGGGGGGVRSGTASVTNTNYSITVGGGGGGYWNWCGSSGGPSSAFNVAAHGGGAGGGTVCQGQDGGSGGGGSWYNNTAGSGVGGEGHNGGNGNMVHNGAGGGGGGAAGGGAWAGDEGGNGGSGVGSSITGAYVVYGGGGGGGYDPEIPGFGYGLGGSGGGGNGELIWESYPTSGTDGLGGGGGGAQAGHTLSGRGGNGVVIVRYVTPSSNPMPAQFAVGHTLVNGLRAYWKMNEATGTRTDSTGNVHLSSSNAVAQAAGKVSNAARFTAASAQSLTSTSSVMSVGASSFTFAGWFYLDSNTTSMLFAKDNGVADQREYRMRYNASTGRFDFAVLTTAGTQVTVIANSSGQVSTGTWYFVVAWFDAGGETLNISVNNGAIDTVMVDGPLVSVNASAFTVGARQFPTAEGYLDGRVDELGLWNRTLTVQERTDLYNAGNGNTYVP